MLNMSWQSRFSGCCRRITFHDLFKCAAGRHGRLSRPCYEIPLGGETEGLLSGVTPLNLHPPPPKASAATPPICHAYIMWCTDYIEWSVQLKSRGRKEEGRGVELLYRGPDVTQGGR